MISNNPFYLSGRRKFESKDFRGAVEDYTRAIEAEENPAIYSERAVVWFYLDKKEYSLADMNYAADLEPDNPYRYSSRAYIKDSMGDTEGAIEDYERAIALDPEDSIAHNNLGLLQEKLGYREKAQQHFARADTLAQVDQLLEEVRKERSLSQPAPTAMTPAEVETEQRQSISWLALLRDTFLTREGFRQYVKFVRDGFRIR